MAGPGLTNLVYTGSGIKLSADGNPVVKIGGVTIDWSTIGAAGSAGVLADGTPYLTGEKWVRYGQVVCKITNKPTNTITVTATSGTYTVTGTRPDTGASAITAPIAYNASAATVQTALETIYGAGNVSVSGTGPYSITPAGALINYVFALPTLNTGSLTGGSATIAATTTNTNYGMYGPYDPSATDGRQTLTPGEVFVVNETWKQNGLIAGMPVGMSDFPQVIEGGRVMKARLIATSGGHSLAAGPTYTELFAALPRLQYVEAN